MANLSVFVCLLYDMMDGGQLYTIFNIGPIGAKSLWSKSVQKPIMQKPLTFDTALKIKNATKKITIY